MHVVVSSPHCSPASAPPSHQPPSLQQHLPARQKCQQRLPKSRPSRVRRGQLNAWHQHAAKQRSNCRNKACGEQNRLERLLQGKRGDAWKGWARRARKHALPLARACRLPPAATLAALPFAEQPLTLCLFSAWMVSLEPDAKMACAAGAEAMPLHSRLCQRAPACNAASVRRWALACSTPAATPSWLVGPAAAPNSQVGCTRRRLR